MEGTHESLGTLYVRLSAITADFAKGMDGAMAKTKEFTEKLKSLADPVAGAAAAMTAMGVASVAAASAIDSGARASFSRLKKSSELLSTNLARVLAPAVREISRMLREMAGFIGGLSPHHKQMISDFGVMAVKVGLAAKAFGILMGLAGGLIGAFRAIAGLLSGTVIAVLAAVAVAVAALHRAWRTNFLNIQDITKSATAFITDNFSKIGKAIHLAFVAPITLALRSVELLLAGLKELKALTPDGQKGPNFDTFGLSAGSGNSEAAKRIQAAIDSIKTMRESIESGSLQESALNVVKDVATATGNLVKEEFPLIKDEILKALGMSGKLSTGIASAPDYEELLQEIRKKAYDDAVALNEQRKSTIGAAMRDEADRAAQEAAYMANVKKTLVALGEEQLSLADFSKTETERIQFEMVDRWRDVGLSWDRASKEMIKAGLSLGQRAELWFGRMGGIFKNFALNKTGALGETIQAVTQGAQAGGPWGAIIAAVMQVVTRMESFQHLLDIFEYGLKRLGEFFEGGLGSIFKVIGKLTAVGTEMIGSIIEALSPIFNLIADAFNDLGPFLAFLSHIFKALAPIIKMLADLFKVFGEILKPFIKVLFSVIVVIVSAVIQLISFIFAKIVQAVAFVVDLFDKNAAAAIRATAKELEASAAAMEELRNMSWDDFQAEADKTAADWDAAAAAKDLTKSLVKVNEAFSNVPEGYRLALTRYRAMRDELNAGGGGGGSDGGVDFSGTSPTIPTPPRSKDPRKQGGGNRGGGNGPGITVNGDINITPQAGYSVEQLAKDIAMDSSRQTGIPVVYPQSRGNF